MSPEETEAEVSKIEQMLTLLPDTFAVYTEWRSLTATHRVPGVQVHDVNLVASMRVYGIARLLTYNIAHFYRYPGIQVFTPQEALML